jgi:energy-coupling factor transport system permease protein
VHRLDGRVKLLAALFLAESTVVASELPVQAALAVLLLAIFACARLGPGLLWRGLRGALWLLGFVAVANALWFLAVQRTSWANGEAAIARPDQLALLLVRLFNLLVLACIHRDDRAGRCGGRPRAPAAPLARLRIPIHELGLLLVLSLSFVPIFQREAERLLDAHRLKLGTRRWGWWARLRAVVPLVVPLFLAVLRRADELAVALDARCFVPGAKRTSLVPSRLGGIEIAALATSAAALAVCLYV